MIEDAGYGGTDRNGGGRGSAAPRKHGVPNDEGSPENRDRAARLEEQARIADRGLDGWREAGIALGKIRHGRLYKATHPKFEGYVKERHGISKGYANKKIAAARAAERIKEVAPIGAKIRSATQALAVAPLVDEDPTKAARFLESLVDGDGLLPSAEAIASAMRGAVGALPGAGRRSMWQVVREDAKRFKPDALHVPPLGAIPWNPRPAPPTGVKSVLKYPGAKANVAAWTVSTFPERPKVYLEPYFGSGTVFFERPRFGLETINDLNKAVVNYFRVLQQSPEELMRLMFTTPWARDALLLARAAAPEGEDPLLAACRTAVRSFMGIGSDIRVGAQNGCRMSYSSSANPAAVWRRMFERLPRAFERLQGVQIENRPALELIRKHRDPEAMIYCDPPYVHGTRKVDDIYELEMTEDDHAEMLSALNAHPGPAAVAGYPHELYHKMLADWQAVYTRGYSQPGAQPRIEMLWLNRVAVERGPVGRALEVEGDREEGAA